MCSPFVAPTENEEPTKQVACVLKLDLVPQKKYFKALSGGRFTFLVKHSLVKMWTLW